MGMGRRERRFRKIHPPPSLPFEGGGAYRNGDHCPHDMFLQERNTTLAPQMFSATDHEFMARALRLAERGLFSTTPNPRVGCVIVKV